MAAIDRITDEILAAHLGGAEAASYFRAHAIEQVGREVPPGWRRRRKRNPAGCYESAGQWAIQSNATYTEGFAFPQGLDLAAIPHAWLTDADGGVIDLSWSTPAHNQEHVIGAPYVGMRLERALVARAINATGCYGPLLPDILATQIDEEAS